MNILAGYRFPKSPHAYCITSPTAYINLLVGVLVTLWKTIGLSFLPGWDGIFQIYTRRPPDEDEARRNLVYLAMYGLSAIVAQACSVVLLKRKSDPTRAQKEKKEVKQCIEASDATGETD